MFRSYNLYSLSAGLAKKSSQRCLQTSTLLKQNDTSSASATVMDYEKVKEIREKHLNPALLTLYPKPLYLTHGHMQYVYDDKNTKYLDLFGGIVTISAGHCHEKVTNALHQQADKIWHTTNLYYHEKIHEYAEKLISKFPKDSGLTNCYFVNSGSEANDLAIMMAKLYTGRTEILSLQNGYHGASPATQGLTCHGNWKYNLPGLAGGHHYAMNADPYNGEWGGKYCRDSPVQTDRDCPCESENDCLAKDKYDTQFDRVLQFNIGQNRLAGFWAEPIQGVGGTIQYPKGWLRNCYDKVHSMGGICIADEVQTGFGRTGTHYWGFEGENLNPDIVVMAKGIGNGFPLGALVTTDEIAKVMGKALTFNTYGGNPLSCAVGSAVLDAIDEDKLQENCHNMGTLFLNKLASLRDEFDIVGDVRGKGLMIAVEFVTDKQSRKPLPAADVNTLLELCRQRGVLYGKGGINGNMFRVKPPMCINEGDVDVAVEVLRDSLKEMLA